MIPTIALLCGVFFSPPATYDSIPLPIGAEINQVNFRDIPELCKYAKRTRKQAIIYGCAYPGNGVVYIPTFETFPGSRKCWNELYRHESAHLKGWRHD